MAFKSKANVKCTLNLFLAQPHFGPRGSFLVQRVSMVCRLQKIQIPWAASSIPARSYTFVEIDHEIISMVILLPSADSFKKVCLSVTSESMCTNSTG